MLMHGFTECEIKFSTSGMCLMLSVSEIFCVQVDLLIV